MLNSWIRATREARGKSPLQILFIIILLVFATELLVMRIISELVLSETVEMLVDASALILILGPPLFYFVYRPLAKENLKYKAMKEEIETAHQMLVTVLDSLDAIVYVADIQTHELLFLNKFARDIFGDVTDKSCWSVLQSGQSGPCDFCSNPKIVDQHGQPTAMYAWEFCNTVNQNWYDIRDRAIPWVDGRIVRLEVATDVTAKKSAEAEKERLILQLEEALAQVKVLSGIVPICMYCKEIRDDQGYWNEIEEFISRHSSAEFSHGICPDCLKLEFPEHADMILNQHAAHRDGHG